MTRRSRSTLPQPTVTHTRAAVTTDHAVNAGAAAFAFYLPQPSVTHTLDPSSVRPIPWLQNLITIDTNPVLLLWSGNGQADVWLV